MPGLAMRLRKSASNVRRARQRAVAPPRFGRNELVDRGTAQRTMGRIRRLGDKAPGGKYGVGILSGGVTGGEANRVRTTLARVRDRNQKLRLLDRPGGRLAGPANPTMQSAKPRGGYGQPPRPDQSQAVRSRGIGAQVRVLAHDKSRTGGIGSQVRELAHRDKQQRSLTGQLRARRRRAARARPRLVRY